MEKSEKLMVLSRAYITKKVEDAREEITIINEDIPQEAYRAIRDIQIHQLNQETGTFELDYDIMQSACNILTDIDLKDLAEADLYELSHDSASVYTSTRLGYMSNQNEADITAVLKEYDCDIQTACAVWYEQQVARACELIREWVLA